MNETTNEQHQPGIEAGRDYDMIPPHNETF